MVRIKRYFYFILVLCCCAAGDQLQHGPVWSPRADPSLQPQTRPAVDWSREILYFLLIDRFCNGDPANDAGRNPASHVLFNPAIGNSEALKTYQGGDLQGVIDRLDYLQDLGITALWLSPVCDNSDSAFAGWWPYHGYSPVNFFAVDEHFGDMTLLQKLVKEAHRRHIKIILDMIYNHVAPDHPWVADQTLWQQEGYRHWFHSHSGVDASTSIQDWQDQEQLENCELNGLPDLNQGNPNVYAFLLDMSKYWILQTGCDGFRLDAVKHIPKSFWRKLCKDLHEFAGPDFLLLGEVFSGDTPYVAGYRDLGFSALFDIPMYYAIHRVFAQGSGIQWLSEGYGQSYTAFPSLLLSPLIDNHDVARFSYWAGERPKEKIESALTYLFTIPGLPMLYYGTEIASPGAAPTHEKTGEGQDYLNRRMMDWQAVYGRDRDLFESVAGLARLRKRYPCLSGGRLVEVYKDYGVYAYLRYDQRNAILVVLNNAGSVEGRRLGLPRPVFHHGRFQDLLTGKKYSLNRDSVDLRLQPHASLLLRFRGRRRAEALEKLPWSCAFTQRLPGDRQWVRFTYRADRPLKSVAIAGDFNAWSNGSDTLQYDEADACWTTRLPLTKGRYRYKIVIDGEQWISDPQAREQELDPFGGYNSVIVVP
ncbi:MAG: Beta/alpha-amylase precursor [bacterium ADurb.Bin478]|nr:MAG: Beta/alpha-amylase precursor [bacterium ADurb.Bin478]